LLGCIERSPGEFRKKEMKLNVTHSPKSGPVETRFRITILRIDGKYVEVKIEYLSQNDLGWVTVYPNPIVVSIGDEISVIMEVPSP
jgi:hypothetical protein